MASPSVKESRNENATVYNEPPILCSICRKDLTHLRGQALNISRHEDKCRRDQSSKRKAPISKITNFFSKVSRTEIFDNPSGDLLESSVCDEADLRHDLLDLADTAHESDTNNDSIDSENMALVECDEKGRIHDQVETH